MLGLRFDVSMEDALLVHVVERLEHLVYDELDLVGRELHIFVRDQLVQILVHQLEY